MTKLQEKLMELEGLKTAQKAAFDAHPDVATIPQDKLTEIKSRNEQIATLQAEVKQLEEIEAMKSIAITYSHSGTPSTKADNTIPAPTLSSRG